MTVACAQLIKLGQDLAKADHVDARTRNTLLLAAIDTDQPMVIDAILKSKRIDINAKNLHLVTPLMLAVIKKHIDSAKKLINTFGIDKNIVYNPDAHLHSDCVDLFLPLPND